MLPRTAPLALAVLPLLAAAPGRAASLTGSGLSFPEVLPDYGQSLELVGRMDLAASDAPFAYDEAAFEYTWALHGPVVHQLRQLAPGIRYRDLTFGVLEIREDPARNSAFVAYPPNMTVPSSFHDGENVLMATVTNLELRDIFGIVTAHADVRFEGGSRLGAMVPREWSFHAAVSMYVEGIPGGYGSRWTFELVPQETTSVDSRSWAGIKALYR